MPRTRVLFAILFSVPAWSVAPAGGGEPAAAPLGDVSRVTPVVRAYRHARPAVVNISTEKVVNARWGLLGPDVFDEIFPAPFGRRVPVHSLGSGFLVHPDGYIVTNAHVVRRAQSITVALADQSRHPAKVISTDDDHDLAVLKIAPPNGPLPHLTLGRSDDLMPGETVLAIGNPLGYGHTVTRGIVSALERTLRFGRGVEYDGLIQTDAPINSGSSGGPLLNIRGELIGINTAIRADAQNIGFAIPVDALIDRFPLLLDFERINRVIFGADIRQRHTEDGDELYVAAVREGTPAARVLRVEDRVIELDGRPVRQIPDFTCSMLACKAPGKVRLVVLRGAQRRDAEVQVLAKPRPDGRQLARKLFGLNLRQVDPQLARDLNLPLTQGLMVSGIDVGSPGDEIGLALKDVIFQVGRLYVTDLDDLGTLLEDVAPGDVVRIGVARGSVAAWVRMKARGTNSE